MIEHLHAPAATLGVGAVHGEEISSEQVGLLAALGAADLHDHRPSGIGVGRNEQGAHPQGECFELVARGVDLIAELASLGVVGRLEEGFGGGEVTDQSFVLGEGGHHRFEGSVASRHLGQAGGVRSSSGIGEPRLEFAVLVGEHGETSDHRLGWTRGTHRNSRI